MFCVFLFIFLRVAADSCECFLSRALLSGSHYVLSLCHCVTLLCYEPDVEQIKMMMMMIKLQSNLRAQISDKAKISWGRSLSRKEHIVFPLTFKRAPRSSRMAPLDKTHITSNTYNFLLVFYSKFGRTVSLSITALQSILCRNDVAGQL